MTLPIPSGTAIPGAINALVAILTNAFASDQSVEVHFGPMLKYIAPVTIQITEVTGDQNPAELAPRLRREETFSIVCSIVSWMGDADYLTRMTTAFSYFTQITPIIGNNATLDDPTTGNPTVRYAQVGNFMGNPGITPEGQSTYTLDFHIRCEQRIESLS